MTLPPCHNLDAYLDGDLTTADATAFEAHAEACSECTDELAASRLLAAEWARLATVTAPAGLVDSALRTAKRGTPDRQPVPASRRRYGRLAALAAFGVLLVALASTALWMQRSATPTQPLQASADPPTPVDTSVAPIPVAPSTENPLRQPEAAPTPSRAAPARQQRTAPTPRRAPAAPAVPVEPPAQLVENATPSDESIAQAKEDLLLALTLVADAQSRAGSTVSTEIGRAAGTLAETSVF